MMIPVKNNQDGFTLVELIMAMAVFSFMLTIILVGFIGVARSHESGVVSRSTQQNARIALDQILKAVQQSGSAQSNNVSTSPYKQDRLCVTQNGQTIVIEPVKVTKGTLDIYQLTRGYTTTGGCAASLMTVPITDDTVTVTDFEITNIAASGNSQGAVGIKFTVASAYGQAFLINNGTQCKATASAQFCSVTTMAGSAGLHGGL